MSVESILKAEPLKMSSLVYEKGIGEDGIRENIRKASLISIVRVGHNFIEGLKTINTPESLRALNESHAYFEEFYNNRKDFIDSESAKLIKGLMEASSLKK